MESYTIKNLMFSYPQQERLVLDDISFSIRKGQFVVLCGPSGCGKTTLLRQLKTVLAPHGDKSGSVFFEGRLLDELNQREQSALIGFVMQSPENQIVTDKVWHELAFGLESLGYDTPAIRLRVAEMASFFGIQGWFYKNVSELSGGQKQLLNLASIMVMQPSVLILDEPTSQLDPIAAADFLSTIGKINRELGTTVILTEHRLEEALPLADRVVVMDEGRIIADGIPKEVGHMLGRENHKMFLAMPVPMRVYAGVPNTFDCPVTVRDGREWLNSFVKIHPLNPEKINNNSSPSYGKSPSGSSKKLGSSMRRNCLTWSRECHFPHIQVRFLLFWEETVPERQPHYPCCQA
jgi:energy-coupling factor transport system ATP-binding protein